MADSIHRPTTNKNGSRGSAWTTEPLLVLGYYGTLTEFDAAEVI